MVRAYTMKQSYTGYIDYLTTIATIYKRLVRRSGSLLVIPIENRGVGKSQILLDFFHQFAKLLPKQMKPFQGKP